MIETKNTLCWSCTRPGTSSCSWDAKLEPVEGWTAIRTQVLLSTNVFGESYHVIHCPLYQEINTAGRDPQYTLSKLDDETLAQCLAAGLTDFRIAEKYGMSRDTIAQRRQKLQRKLKEKSELDKQICHFI